MYANGYSTFIICIPLCTSLDFVWKHVAAGARTAAETKMAAETAVAISSLTREVEDCNNE